MHPDLIQNTPLDTIESAFAIHIIEFSKARWNITWLAAAWPNEWQSLACMACQRSGRWLRLIQKMCTGMLPTCSLGLSESRHENTIIPMVITIHLWSAYDSLQEVLSGAVAAKSLTVKLSGIFLFSCRHEILGCSLSRYTYIRRHMSVLGIHDNEKMAWYPGAPLNWWIATLASVLIGWFVSRKHQGNGTCTIDNQLYIQGPYRL